MLWSRRRPGRCTAAPLGDRREQLAVGSDRCWSRVAGLAGGAGEHEGRLAVAGAAGQLRDRVGLRLGLLLEGLDARPRGPPRSSATSAWTWLTGRAIRLAIVAAPAPALSASGGATGAAGSQVAHRPRACWSMSARVSAASTSRSLVAVSALADMAVDVGHLRGGEVTDRGDVGRVAVGLVAGEQLRRARVGGRCGRRPSSRRRGRGRPSPGPAAPRTSSSRVAAWSSRALPRLASLRWAAVVTCSMPRLIG